MKLTIIGYMRVFPTAFFATRCSTSAWGRLSTSPTARSRVVSSTWHTAEEDATDTTVSFATIPGCTAASLSSALAGACFRTTFGAFFQPRVAAGIDVHVGSIHIFHMELGAHQCSLRRHAGLPRRSRL